ncbi:MAG: hypothetical protein KJ922_03100, partial [Nanoarchaeota archaeon]|nr:hypothetical protein [Nanoarchaeota archaeon]
MARGKKRRFIKRRLFDIGSSASYILGLSGMVPFILSMDIQNQFGRLPFAPFYIVLLSLMLVALGIFIQYRFLRDKKIGKTISSVGRMTFFPGLAIIIFMLFGTGFLIKLAEQLFNPTGAQVVSEYINHSVPRVWIVG